MFDHFDLLGIPSGNRTLVDSARTALSPTDLEASAVILLHGPSSLLGAG